MTPLRRLAYRYLSLPYLVRIKVAQDLGLLAADDQVADEIAWQRLVIERAKDRGLLSALWVASSEAHGESAEPNPFTTPEPTP